MYENVAIPKVKFKPITLPQVQQKEPKVLPKSDKTNQQIVADYFIRREAEKKVNASRRRIRLEERRKERQKENDRRKEEERAAREIQREKRREIAKAKKREKFLAWVKQIKEYWKTHQKPEKPKPEYVILLNERGQRRKIKYENKNAKAREFRKKRRLILSKPHNADMSIVPIVSLETAIDMEFNASEENLPKRINFKAKNEGARFDVEPVWRAADPTKRQSWRMFCRDYLEQNYGVIARALNTLASSGDINHQTQFLKFVMEMGKQGDPASMQVDLNANVHQADVYLQLAEMTRPIALPDTSGTLLEEAKPEPSAEENTTPEENAEEIPVEEVEAETIGEEQPYDYLAQINETSQEYSQENEAE